jgi:hypothetical protein
MLGNSVRKSVLKLFFLTYSILELYGHMLHDLFLRYMAAASVV